jgi:hypothetical protein
MYVYSLSVLAHNFVLLRLLAGITWRRAIINILPHSGEGSQKYRTITTHSLAQIYSFQMDQTWYADDAGAGSFDAIKRHFEKLEEIGPHYGCRAFEEHSLSCIAERV